MQIVSKHTGGLLVLFSFSPVHENSQGFCWTQKVSELNMEIHFKFNFVFAFQNFDGFHMEDWDIYGSVIKDSVILDWDIGDSVIKYWDIKDSAIIVLAI